MVIHVYERERVGGRIKSTPEIKGLTHELGGSMVNHLPLPDLPADHSSTNLVDLTPDAWHSCQAPRSSHLCCSHA